MNVLALCSGVGGLDLGVKLAVPRSHTVCYVEGEAYAVAVLTARMADKTLDEAPIWSDIRTFDGELWRGKVDCVTAGFPCQPVSVAGKRKAQDDERWLWPDVARILGEVRPSLIFLENVPGLITAGLGDILGSLATLGFDAEWCCIRASDIGASHRRERWFCLANATGQRRRKGRAEFTGRVGELASDERGGAVANATGARRKRAEDARTDSDDESQRARGEEPERDCGELADTFGEFIRDEPRWRSGPRRASETELRNDDEVFPPGPNGDWAEWLAEHPDTEPAVCRGSDGLANRVDRLRACGNGVVPLQAAYAWRILSA